MEKKSSVIGHNAELETSKQQSLKYKKLKRMGGFGLIIDLNDYSMNLRPTDSALLQLSG